MDTKVCNKCREEKKVCEFGKLKSSKDGYRYFCKECRKKLKKNIVLMMPKKEEKNGEIIIKIK